MEAAAETKVRHRNQITRLSATLKRLTTELDLSGVKNTLAEMKVLFEALETCHYKHMDSCGSDEDLSEGERWFNQALQEYLAVVKNANKFVKDAAPEPATQPIPAVGVTPSSSQCSVGSELAAALSLPKLTLATFDGKDCTEFTSWLAIFDKTVGEKVPDAQSRLSYLASLLKGDALQAIKPFLVVGDAGAYEKARVVLKERFGNVYLVSHALIKNLSEGVKVVGARDMRRLSDELSLAKQTFGSNEHYPECNSQTFLRKVIDRCPVPVKSQWSKQAFKIKEQGGAYPVFDDLCSFIERQANRANDVYYGIHNPVQVRNASFRTDEVSSKGAEAAGPCACCSGTHALAECQEFISMDTFGRKSVVRDAKACFRCLQGGHFIAMCKADIRCSVPGCAARHHALVHDVVLALRQARAGLGNHRRPEGDRPTNAEPRPHQVQTNTCSARGASKVTLPVIKLYIKGHPVFCLMDSGSTNSLVSRKLADSLGLKGNKIQVQVDTVGSSHLIETESLSFDVTSAENGYTCGLKGVLVVKSIPADKASNSVGCMQLEHLKNLPLDFPEVNQEVDLLIGLDHPAVMCPLESRYDADRPDLAFAVRTRLGWILQGPGGHQVRSQVRINALCARDPELINDIHKLWAVERDNDEMDAPSVEDQKVLDLWDKRTKLEGGHYVIPAPWKPGKPNFSDNRFMAERRLDSTVKRLNKMGKLAEYEEGIHEMVDLGFAEHVPESQLKALTGRTWYIPHHAVEHPVKKKMRIVFDCAAKFKGASLNSECYQGPDLVNRLAHVLLRFRLYENAWAADVRKMYLMVKLPVQDRDCFRFLWRRDGELITYRMTRHLFGGVFCAASSTYALRKVVDDFNCDPEVRECVNKSFYVDDALSSSPSVGAGKAVIHGTRAVLCNAGFDLTKFLANNPDMLEGLPEGSRAEQGKTFEDKESRVLGLRWDVVKDCFIYKPLEDSGEMLTRRSMLSATASLFDPLGFVVPAILGGRLLFQEATRLKLTWDEPIPGHLVAKWRNWMSSLQGLSELSFPRCLIPSLYVGSVAQLHHFGDSSEMAYGTVTYLRLVSPSGEVKVSFLMARGRIAPIKAMTIPRLELCAAVLAVKQDVVLREQLGIQLGKSVFWSDSRAVLAYIACETRRFKVFVANRVAYIREHTTLEQWNYVPTKENPADVVSRGCTADKIPKIWVEGPKFLSEPDLVLEDEEFSGDLSQDPEVRKAEVVVNACSLSAPHDVDAVGRLAGYYSSFYQCSKAVAWLRRFLKWLRSDAKDKCAEPLCSAEVKAGSDVLVRWAQRKVYGDEMRALEKESSIKASSPLVKLSPYLDGGVLRVGGRLEQSELDDEGAHPVILPPGNVVTRALLLSYHSRHHLGVEWVAALVRKRFWVPKLRRELKGIRSKCVTCRRLYGKPVDQHMAGLPPDRCKRSSRPFLNVGVDMCGPFMVKQGRASVKKYVCLFTCATSRAVHLEVVDSLETDSFLNGFRRFCARRGQPAVVRSDNGTNFVGAVNELKNEFSKMDKSRVVREARRSDIQWLFNTPASPNKGGFFEIVVKTVKRILVAVVNPKCALTQETLVTVMCEVENVVNSRPLTRLSVDVDDAVPLCPNHLLIMDGNLPWTWSEATSAEFCRRRWRRVQAFATMFWQRWLREYLPELQRRQKWTAVRRNLAVGQLVLVVDKNAPRGLWNTGVVVGVRQGRDGLVRSVEVRTRLGTVVRGVGQLVLLELDCASSSADAHEDE